MANDIDFVVTWVDGNDPEWQNTRAKFLGNITSGDNSGENRYRRMSATLVGAIGGIFTPASFLGLHLFGSATGLWGVWNFSYFALMKGVEYQGNYYQGVDWLSWVLLFHMVPCCVPCAVIGFKHWRRLKKEAQLG